MQHNSNSPWRLPLSPPGEYPKSQYSLNHTMSMVNLHEEPTWYANRGPPSPTASSVSSTTSRSTTPTTSNNPWSNLMASPNSSNSTNSKSPSPKDSPNRTPQYTSRSTTPVAPQPMRPIQVSTGFIPMSSQISTSGDSFRIMEYATSPISNFPGSPNPYRQNSVSLPQIMKNYTNSTFLAQGQSPSQLFYELARRQGWELPIVKKVWQWALSNPRIALLLASCDDVPSWRPAMFFDLTDNNLPFTEAQLTDIVHDPQRVLNEQWRATSKELPLNGSHVDFGARETVPLQHMSMIRSFKSPEKSADRVRMLGNNEDRSLVRKRFVVTRPSQKATLLKQIEDFKRYDHKNITKLLSSYAQMSHIGILTSSAQYTLDDYFSLTVGEPNRSKQLLDWMYDLSQAIDYLHSQSISHRSIRPRKILINGSRIYLAPFGIGQSGDTFSPSIADSLRLDQIQSYFQDQSYIYAAPEAIISRGKKPGRPADVFSLGCVFLCMMTVVQNQPSLSIFTQYRAGSSHDASFHGHLDRVASWRNRLHASATQGLRNGVIGSGRKQRQLKSEVDWLQIIEKMVQGEPQKRIKMKRLVSILDELRDGKALGVRRRSLDGGGYSGQVAASLGLTNSNNLPNNVANGANGTHGANANGTVNVNTNGNASGNSERRPELSVFDGYFQQQGRDYEHQGSGW
ncbi:kinase-like protein [Amniculicola lignicola CBS 123094]|uniref:Kinase-like protein n=1 Tax=Amniculicola lignicola CBS 123094 TaxID=1392246 RepID=A0A6A5W5E3_9PLEO|nr:kinase-like protein [Amniculicola lignicola CBS 123094]